MRGKRDSQSYDRTTCRHHCPFGKKIDDVLGGSLPSKTCVDLDDSAAQQHCAYWYDQFNGSSVDAGGCILCTDGTRAELPQSNFTGDSTNYFYRYNTAVFPTITCEAPTMVNTYANTDAELCDFGYFIDFKDANKCKKCPVGTVSCYSNPKFDPSATEKTFATELRTIATTCKSGFFLDLQEFRCVANPGTGLVSPDSDETRYCMDHQCGSCSQNYRFCDGSHCVDSSFTYSPGIGSIQQANSLG